jgi:hypothetical protein
VTIIIIDDKVECPSRRCTSSPATILIRFASKFTGNSNTTIGRFNINLQAIIDKQAQGPKQALVNRPIIVLLLPVNLLVNLIRIVAGELVHSADR